MKLFYILSFLKRKTTSKPATETFKVCHLNFNLEILKKTVNETHKKELF